MTRPSPPWPADRTCSSGATNVRVICWSVTVPSGLLVLGPGEPSVCLAVGGGQGAPLGRVGAGRGVAPLPDVQGRRRRVRLGRLSGRLDVLGRPRTGRGVSGTGPAGTGGRSHLRGSYA